MKLILWFEYSPPHFPVDIEFENKKVHLEAYRLLRTSTGRIQMGMLT